MNFTEIMGSLNSNQSVAVNTLDGAILVLAGAGTGKTQTLSARAANMLRSEQMIDPQNILCLTFTDAASYAMRKRLIDMVGTEAYRIGIYTFHSWCNEIIQDNLHIFGVNDLEIASELEINNIIKQIIDELSHDNPLYRVKGDRYYELRRLKNLFSLMKRENLDYETLSYHAKTYINSLPTREEFIYKRNGKDYKAGDLKVKAIEDETRKMDQLLAGADQMCRYDELMQQHKRYDFDDMIQWVIGQFQTNENFLRNYQERYQYIMVDEFQDTNGSQMKLIELLASYWEDPNLFVVGDDNQTIYEFGGARLKNMKDFIDRYKASIIFLDENYRSHQNILDVAGRVIKNNSQRLISDQGLKSMITCNPTLMLVEAANIINEEAYVFSQINYLIDSGVEPGEIAVLYRKHRQGDNLIRLLKNTGIPVNVKRTIDILQEPIIIHLCKILEYYSSYYTLDTDKIKALAFEIMHYPYYKNDLKELHAYQIRGEFDQFPGLRALNDFVEDYVNLQIVPFLEILTYRLIMPYVVASANRIKLNLILSSFFDFVKTEAFKDPFISGGKLIENIKEMISEGIRLSIMDVNTDETGVTCSTIHGAKGLEWKYVYLIGCIRSEWEKSRGAADSYALPDTITISTGEDNMESNRRLFYVACTRAKTSLIISYSRKDNFNKDLEPSQYVVETQLLPVLISEVDLNPVMEAQLSPEVKQPRADKQYMQYAVSDTHTTSISEVNKYLDCQVQFYYENVLKAPFVANEALVYGNAIHAALYQLYTRAKSGGMKKDEFVGVFMDNMNKYRGQIQKSYIDKRIALGVRELSDYYDNYYPLSNKVTLCEFPAKVVLPNGIPFKYIFDKLEFDGYNAIAVDYKSGSESGVMSSIKPGGHYYRQMLAAKLVLDSIHGKGWKFVGSRIDLFDDGYKPIPVDFAFDELSLVLSDIMVAYTGIINHKFDVGCGKCKWCLMENNM